MKTAKALQKFFPVAISYGAPLSTKPSEERIVKIRECSTVGSQERVWARVAAVKSVRIFNVRVHRAPKIAERLEHKKLEATK